MIRVHYLQLIKSTDNAILVGFKQGSMWIPKTVCSAHRPKIKELVLPKSFYEKKMKELLAKKRRTPIQRMLRGI